LPWTWAGKDSYHGYAPICANDLSAFDFLTAWLASGPAGAGVLLLQAAFLGERKTWVPELLLCMASKAITLSFATAHFATADRPR
jgi:hypothetical protein